MLELSYAEICDLAPIVTMPVEAPKMRKPRAAKPKTEPTLADLRALCAAKGLKFTTKHTKPELAAILRTGQYIRPAAYARAAAKRKLAAG